MDRNKKRIHRKRRIRAKISGNAQKPRLAVFRSLQNITVQIIDDNKEKTLLTVSLKDLPKKKNDVSGALAVGELIAKKCLDNKIKQVIFDRSGYKYHGKVKAVAEGAKKGGLKF
jgi:large subunit ribosomal protein L18